MQADEIMVMMVEIIMMMIMMIRINCADDATLTTQAGRLGIIWRARLKREQSAAPLDVKTT